MDTNYLTESMMNMSLQKVCFFSLLFLVISCSEEVIYTPKPRAYPKVIYPEKAYQSFSKDYCTFTFDYPQYATIEKDTKFFDGNPKDACWFDIYIADFNARIHCSYIPINKTDTFEKLHEDAFKMANEHIVKANYIDELPIKKPNGVSGFVFDFGGPTATPFSFYLTDSIEHYFRGALYFNTKVRPDSLAPVVDFVKADMMKMINTFEWKDKEK